ncbi:fungal-specific transcription factor domain-containing protein [Truncatella angustata]|uniref:Fungal-specific transcription factor domain-containing protein n=1 Tax=Truncatella angustata TaxID=152316 RepID=A0A9P8RIX4_9PEZI|nr:fungal-specific transcription factor domain-containing protein [Truncatella angustata]KAH6646883.1 fungal-specific transcription factor domain-containing protein [Truncatella angustata]
MATNSNGNPAQPKTIRFVNNQGQPPQKRRRINAACLTCRRRKTRCAGEQPECTTCIKNGHKCLGYTDLPVQERKRDSVSGVSPHDAVFDNQEGEYPNDETVNEQRHCQQPNNVISRQTTEAGATSSQRLSDSPHQSTHGPVQLKSEIIDWEEPRSFTQPGAGKPIRRSTNPQHSSFSTQDGRSPSIRSPTAHHNHNQTESHRMPYFRYFGPTAIVPGFKQMVVKVHDRRRSSMSATSPGSGISFPSLKSIHSEHDYDQLDDVPVYDPHDSGPVHPLILELIEGFFTHLGCNYPFLQQEKLVRWVKEKREEPILVDAICALAARFSDSPILNKPNSKKPSKADNGHVFAQRAKAATVDTFPCPSVAAVQACLLMAYEGFGADQDSALWMYLGLAIRMAVDLGLHKKDGVKYQGEKDAWYTRSYNRKHAEHDDDNHQNKPTEEDKLSEREQKQLEQERIDTLWAVFMLDRVISSGTGRPVTLRDGDFELELPKTPTGTDDKFYPDPFPALLQIIHLYGRVSDVLNEVVNPNDLTDERMNKLFVLEHELTKLHQNLHINLRFDALRFQEYVRKQQGTTFILLHLWFHAMIIVLHQPALLAPLIQYDQGRELGSQSREISMSSAKTIADILAFANLIDAKSFIGNPFTSQPIYIAACAFLVESEKTNASQPVSRNPSPPSELGIWAVARASNARNGFSAEARTSKRHFLLASAANQNYQACNKALQQMHMYWGGIRYILTALDQKSEGIWDCETYTREEYESTRLSRHGDSLQRLIAKAEQGASPTPQPQPPPLAWSLTGTTNTPGPSLSLLYPANSASATANPSATPAQPSSAPSAPTTPGNMIYDPIRQSLPEAPQMYPPAYGQPNTSALRHSVAQSRPRRLSSVSGTTIQINSRIRFDGNSPSSTITELNLANNNNGNGTGANNVSSGPFSTDAGPSNFAQSGLASSGYSYLESTGQGLDIINIENQTEFGPALTSFGTAEMVSWFGEYMPSDVLSNLYDDLGSSMGQ